MFCFEINFKLKYFMKNLNFIYVLCCVLILAACEKNETGGSDSYTTVEEGKNVVQNSGVQMVAKLDELSKLEGIDASRQMIHLFDESSPLEKSGSTVNTLFIPQLKGLVLFSQKQMAPTKYFEEISVGLSGTVTATEQDYLDNCGTYTWNKTDSSWTYVKGGTTVVISFPATETSATNNASFTISKFDVDYVIIDGDTNEFPLALSWNLKVSNTTLISFDYNASVANDLPTSISATLTISPFSINVSASNTNNQNAAISYSFKHNTTTLLGYSVSATGNWSESNIESSTYKTYDYDTMYYYDYSNYPDITKTVDTIYTYTNDSVALDKIVNSLNAEIILMDVTLNGIVNVAQLYKKIAEIDNAVYASESAQTDAGVKAINDYVQLQIKQTSAKKVIADVKAYKVEKTETYYDYEYLTVPPYYKEVQKEKTTYDIDFRLEFNDGSKADMDTYFETGFSNLETELNKFLTQIDEEWNLGGVKPVDFDKPKQETTITK